MKPIFSKWLEAQKRVTVHLKHARAAANEDDAARHMRAAQIGIQEARGLDTRPLPNQWEGFSR